jgi:hypothetical protein
MISIFSLNSGFVDGYIDWDEDWEDVFECIEIPEEKKYLQLFYNRLLTLILM